MHPVAESLEKRFAGMFLGSRESLGDLTVYLRAENALEIFRALHDDPEYSYDYIVDVTSVDYPMDPERFEVVYILYSLSRRHRIMVKVRVTEDSPVVDSVVGIWKGAEFMEREVYDMMGIQFRGHPDLRRILMPDDYEEGYPLRKDFPLVGKGWRDSFSFVPRFQDARPEIDGKKGDSDSYFPV
uniref:NADH-quinone oxidoreductase subunit C n=1 Tax=Leptospirillum ferriphilum TaxID=178606 RepID=K4EPV8_9BACT|nr:NADH quinone oxidoreductase C subunit [Leptospirillum ferriphilum]